MTLILLVVSPRPASPVIAKERSDCGNPQIRDTKFMRDTSGVFTGCMGPKLSPWAKPKNSPNKSPQRGTSKSVSPATCGQGLLFIHTGVASPFLSAYGDVNFPVSNHRRKEMIIPAMAQNQCALYSANHMPPVLYHQLLYLFPKSYPSRVRRKVILPHPISSSEPAKKLWRSIESLAMKAVRDSTCSGPPCIISYRPVVPHSLHSLRV